MGQPTTAVLDIDAIHVEEGFNPRKGFDDEQLQELVASIHQDGITTALTVRPNGGTGYVLVAGERRLRAAKQLGLKKVPVLIREKKGALAAAFAENEFRADLNPIEVGEVLQRLASEEGLKTQKQLAERVGKSTAFVAERLRLLKLPEKVQAYIADGTVPLDAERNLRVVAKASPRAAECVCELVAKGSFAGRDLLTAFDDVLVEVAEGGIEEDPPTLLDPKAIRWGRLITDKKARKEFRDRYRVAAPYSRGIEAVIALSGHEVDAARAAGCLLELDVDHGGWTTTLRYITDEALAADLLERYVARLEKEAVKAPKAETRTRARSAENAAAEVRKEERQHREEAMESARRHNEEVGRLLINRRKGGNRKEDNLRRARAVAVAVLGRDASLAAAGLRLALPQLREAKPKKGAKGKEGGATYASASQAADYVFAKIEAATTDSEVVRILGDAMVAAFVVDPDALPFSEQTRWYSQEQELLQDLLAADIKAVTPAGSGEGK